MSDAMKGGAAVASRVRIAAATSLVISGLLLGGAGAALAFADPDTDDRSGSQQRDDDSSGNPEPKNTPGPANTATKTATRPTRTTEPTQTTRPTEPTRTTRPTEPTDEPGCADKDDDCGPGWPWWPSWLPEPGAMPIADGGGGAVEVPADGPTPPAAMQVPAHVGVARTAPPVVPAPAVVPAPPVVPPPVIAPPVTLPVIVAPSAADGGAASAPLPDTPVAAGVELPARPATPRAEGLAGTAGPVSSYRLGYPDVLQNAGMAQLVALAAPGVAGMLVLTGAGGLVGYRQAKAGHAVHPGAARFVN